MAQFILKINLGNDAMRTAHDIHSALYRTAKKIYESDMNISDMREPIRILDLNGNAVGTFQVINTFVPNCKKFNCRE